MNERSDVPAPTVQPVKPRCTNCNGVGYFLNDFDIPGGGERLVTSNGYECEVCHGSGVTPVNPPSAEGVVINDDNGDPVGGEGDTQPPTFEQLLADPMEQFDKRSELLGSVLTYLDAPSNTASATHRRGMLRGLSPWQTPNQRNSNE